MKINQALYNALIYYVEKGKIPDSYGTAQKRYQLKKKLPELKLMVKLYRNEPQLFIDKKKVN
jgi:hypothetical protein